MRSKILPSFVISTLAALILSVSIQADNPHLRMGNPSKATADTTEKDNYLMEKEYFSLSYNDSKGTPNWVSWRLTKNDFGDAPRAQFYPDQDLPAGFTRIMPRDYVGSGFDRGHMCPHSDRDAYKEMSKATFVMSNIVPQSPRLNQKAWNQLEIYCRSLVESGKILYIVSGPVGKGGTGKLGKKEVIIKQHTVTVPEKCWKVIMVLEPGPGDDLKRVTADTRLIAIIMPNDMTLGDEWDGYRVPVKEVEELTGYTFFDKVSSDIIEPLKEERDEVRIPPPQPVIR